MEELEGTIDEGYRIKNRSNSAYKIFEDDVPLLDGEFGSRNEIVIRYGGKIQIEKNFISTVSKLPIIYPRYSNGFIGQRIMVDAEEFEGYLTPLSVEVYIENDIFDIGLDSVTFNYYPVETVASFFLDTGHSVVYKGATTEVPIHPHNALLEDFDNFKINYDPEGYINGTYTGDGVIIVEGLETGEAIMRVTADFMGIPCSGETIVEIREET